MKKKLHVYKIGGNVIDNEVLLDKFLADFSSINESKILIHGGGKIATSLAEKLNIPQNLIDGRRITDAETLEVIVMTYGGLINKKLVAKLQGFNCDSIGLSGADGNVVKGKMRKNIGVDYGFVGDVELDGVNNKRITQFIGLGLVPVFCAISHDGNGLLLNTNADTIASKIASSLSVEFDVSLVYCFEKKGVLLDVNDENSFLPFIYEKEYERLKEEKIVSEGMIPKLDNAFEALILGVKKVKICHAEDIYFRGTELVLLN